MEKINPQIWQNYDEAQQIRLKAEVIREWIPSGVSSILDIGCGNGIITNLLAQDYDVTGVDISLEALQDVQTPKIQASATAIPLESKSFDLVLSSEMIEHLDDDDLQAAVGEMIRLSKRYILISVPNREQLAKSNCKCASCGFVYHAYGHLHSFSTSALRQIFPGYRLVREMVLGPDEKLWQPTLLKIKQKLGAQYFHPNAAVLCPACGSEQYLYHTGLLARALNLLNRLVSRARPYWLMLLLEKVD